MRARRNVQFRRALAFTDYLSAWSAASNASPSHRDPPATMSWYYAQSNQPQGPIPEPEFLQLVARGIIDPATLVWREGMPQWQPWANVRDQVMAALPPAAPNPDGTPHVPENRIPCAVCHAYFPHEDLVPLGGRRVCATCKPLFLQRVREGVAGWGSLTGDNLIPEGIAHADLTEEELLARDYDVPAVALYQQAAERLLQEPSTLLVGGILTLVIMGVAQMVPWIGFIVQAVVWGPLAGGLFLAYIRRIRGGTMAAGDVFGGFGPRFGSLFVAHFLPWILTLLIYLIPIVGLLFLGISFMGVATTGGSPPPAGMFAVLGGLCLVASIVSTYLSISWAYTLPLVADRNYTTWEAMGLSRRIVGKHFWQHFWMFFLAGIAMTVGILFCCVGALFTLPMIALAGTLLYERLFHGLASKRLR